MLRHLIVLTFVAMLPTLGHGDDLSDLCKESPDLCTGDLAPKKPAATSTPSAAKPRAAAKRDLSTNQVTATNTKTVKRSANGTKDGRKNYELSTTQDNWDDLQSENQIYEKPAPGPAKSAGPPPPMRKPSAVAGVGRGPASIPSARPAAPAAAVIPKPATRAPNMTFESYMTQNAVNPAMTNRIQDHQKAFADLSKPAVITIPGAEPDIVPAPTSSTNAAGGTTNPNGNAVLPSVGALPTIDGGSTGGSSYSPSGGGSSSGAGLPIR